MSLSPDEIQSLDEKCSLLLKESGVRFVGFINHMGRQIAGRYRGGITPLVDEEEHKISLEHTLEIMLTKDLDHSLGSIDSIITRRRKVMMITIPFEGTSLLISAEKESNPEKIIENALKIFK